MTTVSVGSGLGGQMMIAQQDTYGGEFATPTRTLRPKSCKMTFDPHLVQGGPYLAAGQAGDIASAFVGVYLDAKGSYASNFFSTGEALMLAMAMGSAKQTLTQFGTTTAYTLSCDLGFPLANQNVMDFQLGVPTTDGTVNPYSFHSTKITKAEWTIERGGLLTTSYDLDSQFVDTSTDLTAASPPSGPSVFSYGNTSSAFSIGTYGSEEAVDGIRKATITVEQKQDTDRAYLGNEYKDEPVSDALIEVTIALEADFTTAAKTGLFDLFLPATPTSIIVDLVGPAIGSSSKNNEITFNAPAAYVMTGGEPPLEGPAIVKNTITLKGKIDSSNHPMLTAVLTTGDSAF